MVIFWAYVERRDTVMKRSQQKNFIRPMSAFPSFLKELNSDVDEEEGEVEAIGIASDNDGEEVANRPFAPPTDGTVFVPPSDGTTSVPPLSTEQMKEQDCEINRIIDYLTKSKDAEDDMPINSLEWKPCYSTWSN
ncbi:hypothetical protein PVK06_043738 [Gossypium arboreum]|uniref:Uncharacterized protein n=1 Tax=Gossypium arboreum TaxID=29729 RepID=A0ABR0MPL5_GOSAR|nr:hypothetical protein PVK06_043738 [Gossypium arboreum]